jgi:uncharacterized protein (DUF2147 family)
MRRLLVICAAVIVWAAPAWAAEPVGEWRVANGEANIRIDDCDGALWGIVSWEKDPGVDSSNPNPAERTRPTLGIHILKGMRPTKPGQWQGEIYNAENGKTYDSRLSLPSPDVLRVEGCVFGGLFCGGENWTRVSAPAPARGRPQANAAAQSACSGLAGGARTPHKGGLK